MKYELSSAQFKPFCIFFSVIFLPITIALLVYTILDFRIELLIIVLLLFSVYLFIIWLVNKECKKENNYVTLYDKHLLIKHPNANNCKETKFLYKSIARFEYYKMTSLKAWLNLFMGLCPNCVFIVYYEEGKEKKLFVGYLSYKNIYQISQITGIDFRTV